MVKDLNKLLEFQNAEKAKKIFSTFANKNRRAILVLCYKQAYNINQISQELGINYNIAFANVKHLEKLALVEIEAKKHEKNKPSMVKTSEIAISILASMAQYTHAIDKAIKKQR